MKTIFHLGMNRRVEQDEISLFAGEENEARPNDHPQWVRHFSDGEVCFIKGGVILKTMPYSMNGLKGLRNWEVKRVYGWQHRQSNYLNELEVMERYEKSKQGVKV